jgi:hypothetical protein
MKSLDRTLSNEIIAKLAKLPPDVKPLWGKMNRDQLYGHLALVFRYTLGELPPLPYKGNWRSRNIYRHLIINGVIEIPHNIRLPRPKGLDKDAEVPTCAIEDLQNAMDAYVTAAEQGTLQPALHPFFGVLSPKEWRKFHVAHLKHHCKQFGVW